MRAHAEGGYSAGSPEGAGRALSLQAAEALLHAHLRAEEAFDVARAVDLARLGLDAPDATPRQQALFAPGGDAAWRDGRRRVAIPADGAPFADLGGTIGA